MAIQPVPTSQHFRLTVSISLSQKVAREDKTCWWGMGVTFKQSPQFLHYLQIIKN